MIKKIKATVVLDGGEAEVEIATKVGRAAYSYEDTICGQISDDGDITIEGECESIYDDLARQLIKDAAATSTK